jgi:hypothetical protein
MATSHIALIDVTSVSSMIHFQTMFLSAAAAGQEGIRGPSQGFRRRLERHRCTRMVLTINPFFRRPH